MTRYLYLAVVCLLASSAAFGQSRSWELNLNRSWMFHLGDVPLPVTCVASDTAWKRVHLPHSFSIPYFRARSFYTGYGWYQKILEISPAWLHRSLWLEFDGVFQVAEVYLNGQKLTIHKGGYSSFTVAIGQAVRAGSNRLDIRVNNLWDPALAPRNGEHVFSGGIYRDVRLCVSDPLHVAWYGTFVTTPRVSAISATVNVRTTIQNDGKTPKTCVVSSWVRDAAGRTIARLKTRAKVPPGTALVIEQLSGKIRNPRLWTPETPYLYTVRTEVSCGGRRTDRFESPFGFRWLRWTADSGLFVNGRHYYLRGANVHQDHAGWGDAVTRAGVYRDIKLIKEAGFNFIRGSHYPHHPYFAEVCDRLGLFFLPENPVWGTGYTRNEGSWNASAYPTRPSDTAAYEASALAALTNMIRVNRNHPSVIAWSMCNEPFFTADIRPVKALLRRLAALSHQLDPTRKTVIGGAQRGGIDHLGDIAGYNGDGATLFARPGIPSLVTEYSSSISDRPGSFDPGWFDLKDGAEPPWRSGQAIWCGFDHGSTHGAVSKMGIIDYFRIPKRAWYWYRQAYRGIPPPVWPATGKATALQLRTDRARLVGTGGTDDALLTVTVIGEGRKPVSASPPVTLRIVSGPGTFPTGRTIRFEPGTDEAITIQDGQAAIEFRSYEAGLSVIEATSPGLKKAVIRLETRGWPRFRPGKTPLAPDLPYQAPHTLTPVQRGPAQLVSRLHPAFASDSKAGHAADQANDGNTATFWQARPDQPAWWSLDLETMVYVTKLRLQVPQPVSGRLVVEISEDGQKWNRVAASAELVLSGQDLDIPGREATYGRFVRLTFKGQGGSVVPAVSELEVWGIPE